MVQKVAVSREFEARLRHAATGKLSLSTQQKMGTFFELGKDKAAKGEGWAPPFISCAQDRAHTRQGNVREIKNFSRSGNCQGIS